VVLAPLYLKCLSGRDASAHSTASAAHVPLDIVAAVGDGVPVVVAFGITVIVVIVGLLAGGASCICSVKHALC